MNISEQKLLAKKELLNEILDGKISRKRLEELSSNIDNQLKGYFPDEIQNIDKIEVHKTKMRAAYGRILSQLNKDTELTSEEREMKVLDKKMLETALSVLDWITSGQRSLISDKEYQKLMA